MPLTPNFDIYYRDTSSPASLETESALQADSVDDALVAITGSRAIQTFRWANAAARNAQTGMVAGDVGYQVDTAVIYLYQTSAWKAWESGWITYTPTVSGFVVGTGGAVSSFAYKFVEGRVRVKYLLVRGSSGASAGPTTFTLPLDRIASPVAYDRVMGLGTAGSPTASYATTHSMNASSTSAVRILYIGSPEAVISSTAPFTWATGYFLSGELEYDPA